MSRISINVGIRGLVSIRSPSSAPFVSTWKTDNAGTSLSNQIKIPATSTGVYSCTVDWGDGTTSTISSWNDPAWTHTYALAGTYVVKIYGIFKGLFFNNIGDRLKLLNISQWGGNFRLKVVASLYGCSNLTITTKDILNLEGTPNLSNAFRNCTSLTSIPYLNNWNFSAVTSMPGMFNGCSSFNQEINFNTSSALTNLSAFLTSCSVFDSPVTFANTSNVTSWGSMFQSCVNFNQPLTGIPSLEKATTVNNMFQNCYKFNQPLSHIPFSSTITTTANMFQACTVFDQDLSFMPIASLSNASAMFTGSAFSKVNYNKLLDSATGWPSQAVVLPNVVFSAGTAHYDGVNAITGRAFLTGTKTWTITDGGTP